MKKRTRAQIRARNRQQLVDNFTAQNIEQKSKEFREILRICRKLVTTPKTESCLEADMVYIFNGTPGTLSMAQDAVKDIFRKDITSLHDQGGIRAVMAFLDRHYESHAFDLMVAACQELYDDDFFTKSDFATIKIKYML